MTSNPAVLVQEEILSKYLDRTKVSKKYHDEAKKFLPGGVTRNLAFNYPYPVFMEKGAGCFLYDYDGNEYLDFVNTYTALIHGHADPDIIKAVSAQLHKGTSLSAPSPLATKLANILCDRIPALEMIRFTNSGTEATLFAIRAARAYTRRDMFIKIDGGYHGSHDFVEVNVTPDVDAELIPSPHLQERGIPSSILDYVLVAPFNNLELMESLLNQFRGKIAAILVEPLLGTSGVIPPKDGYLKGLRELANKYDVLLVFDEIVTFRLSRGGLQEFYDVEPDLTTIGKCIGGGFPIGAFGGKKEVMAQFDPTQTGYVGHSGTFSGNNITMAAGIAAVEKYGSELIEKINKLGDKLRNGLNERFKKTGIRGQVIGHGSILQIHWGEGEIVTAKDAGLIYSAAKKLPALFHLEMMNRGIYVAPRGYLNVSTPMREEEIDKTIEQSEAALKTLRPYVNEIWPNSKVQ